ncbi:hypothetical protein [Desulfosarcina ovata]|uniref:hypothetical protein n=1 Tax=Desulfosarcina ovata TaxID=83564 RepID=UPI0012D36DA8|nr:hypothetical protein [Desulfosarcina ovata]
MKSPHGSTESGKSSGYIAKKCPECMEYMPLNATRCPSCKLPVGRVDRHGKASRKTDWKGYLTAIAAWAFFFFYIWWAFLREH